MPLTGGCILSLRNTFGLMNKPLYTFFTEDHRRIEALLDEATSVEGHIDADVYHQFRIGLLRHIKMEEKILFPAAQKANGGVPLPLAAKLRLDHGALTMLMLLSPDDDLISVLRHVLEEHDRLEEERGGMYEACERLTADETEELLHALHQVTEVPVHPYNDSDQALNVAKRALERAGFHLEGLVGNARFGKQ